MDLCVSKAGLAHTVSDAMRDSVWNIKEKTYKQYHNKKFYTSYLFLLLSEAELLDPETDPLE